jgi:hypothetical protein
MAGSFDERVSELSARWIAAVDRHARSVLALVAVATVALGVYAAETLGVNADLYALVSPDVPFLVRKIEFEKTFQALDTSVLVLVDGDSATSAGRAADALAERLGQRKDLFERVSVVGGGDFFRHNALLFLDKPQIEKLADRLSALQPFLAQLARDQSLVGISKLLTQALEAQRSGTNVGLDLPAALDRVDAAVEAANAGRAAPDPWGDALVGGSLSEEARHRVLTLRPRVDFGDALYAKPAVDAIRKAARDLGLDASSGVRVRITGDEILNYEEQEVIQTQAQLVAVFSLILFAVAIWFGMRSFRMVFALVATLVVSLIWTNAFAAAAVGALNQVSAAFNVLIVGLGGEFGIHVCMRYAELASKGHARANALEETGRSIGSSLISSAGTTAIGFLVFAPTDYRGVAQLGVISGAGVVLSLIASFTVLPALLSWIGPVGPSLARPTPPWIARLRHVPLVYARPIRVVAAALGVGSLALLPGLHFDHNSLNLRDPSTESVQAFEDLISRSGTSPWTVDVITPSLAQAQTLASALVKLPDVEKTRTLDDFVPADQEEKRAILNDVALLLPPAAKSATDPGPEAEREALEHLSVELATTAASTGSEPSLTASARRLADALRHFLDGPARTEEEPALAQLQSNVVGSLPDQVHELERVLAPAEVTADDLPDEIRGQMLAGDGRARVQVISSADLGDSAVLEKFVDSVRELAPEATGPAVTLLEWGRVTSGAMKQALIAGVVAMTLFLLLLWRNVWDTVLAVFPLALAGLVSCAVMVLLGLSFNFANVIVLPMLLGMGIDNGVHLVHRHRTNPEEEDVLGTSTARAVFFAALTTVLCFGSLAFAPHRGMASLGQFLTLGVAATFVSYVVVLPAVLEWDDRRAGRQARRAAAGTRSADPGPA